MAFKAKRLWCMGKSVSPDRDTTRAGKAPVPRSHRWSEIAIELKPRSEAALALDAPAMRGPHHLVVAVRPSHEVRLRTAGQRLRSFDHNLPRLRLFSLGERNGQQAVLVCGRGLALIDESRQPEEPRELPFGDLTQVVFL